MRTGNSVIIIDTDREEREQDLTAVFYELHELITSERVSNTVENQLKEILPLLSKWCGNLDDELIEKYNL